MKRLSMLLMLFISAFFSSESIAAEVVKDGPMRFVPPPRGGAEDFDYRKAMFGELDGKKLYRFGGKINQVIENTQLKVAAWNGDGDIMLFFSEKPSLIENDVANFDAYYIGLYEYITVMGAKKVIPKMAVSSYEIPSGYRR